MNRKEIQERIEYHKHYLVVSKINLKFHKDKIRELELLLIGSKDA